MYGLYAADFENTVPRDEGELKDFETFVWGAGLLEVGTDKMEIYECIEDFMEALTKKSGKVVVYFHNLAYDGRLIVDYLMRKCGFIWVDSNISRKVEPKTFSTLISDRGVWYNLKVNYKRKVIEFRDSLKIMPFKLEVLAKQLGTKHGKLVGDVDYAKHREPGYHMTEQERRYLENDVYVLAEALEAVDEFGLTESLTIGSHCLKEYKKLIGKERFTSFFPVLDSETDKEIRRSYRGGWCFNNTKGDIHVGHGYVYDVNSLYPSVMVGNPYPVGVPHYFSGDEFPKYEHSRLYTITVRVAFTLKENKLPFVQVKRDYRYEPHEYITTTSVDGMFQTADIGFTRPEWELFQEHYNIDYLEILGGYWYSSANNLFDKYIDYWYGIKKNAKNKVERTIAKLMLNNLYGKMATSLNADYQCVQFKDNKVMYEIISGEKEGLYIPVGAYVTAYAKCKTIRAAQENYDSFLYSDTDSIHLDQPSVSIAVGKELGEWDLESEWDVARFVRQKTYVERFIKEDGEECEPHLVIKACGCPDNVKERMLYNVTDEDGFHELERDENDKVTSPRREDMEVIRRFKPGLTEYGKLSRRSVIGGVVLYPTTFRIQM